MTPARKASFQYGTSRPSARNEVFSIADGIIGKHLLDGLSVEPQHSRK